jgi:hypothetical protein
VDDLPVVDMLDCERDLRDPGDNFFFSDKLLIDLCLLNPLAEIASLSVAHDDIEVAIFALEGA